MAKFIYTPDFIKEKLFLSDEWLERALVALYDLQTEEEKDGEHPDIHNGVGFSRYDADMLSAYAVSVKRGDRLGVNEIRRTRNRITKYAGQLAKLANGQIERPN